MATGSLERLPLTPTSMLKQFTLLPAATHSTDVGVRGFVKQSVSCSKVCLCVIANLNSQPARRQDASRANGDELASASAIAMQRPAKCSSSLLAYNLITHTLMSAPAKWLTTEAYVLANPSRGQLL